MQVLLELIQTKLNYVVQEAIVVIKDIFRRYPNKCAHPLCWIRQCGCASLQLMACIAIGLLALSDSA